MAVISTAQFAKAQWPGIKAFWEHEINAYTPHYRKVFEVLTSDKAYEEFVQMTSFGTVPVKAQGAAIVFDSHSQGPTTRISAVTRASGFSVTMEELADNQYEKVRNARVPQLTKAFMDTKEQVCANIFNRAFNSSYALGDGVELISASHVYPSGGTYSNKLGTDAELSEVAMEDLLIQLMRAKNDRGHILGLKVKSLLVSPDNYFNSLRLLKSVNQSGTANNDINAIATSGLLPGGIISNPFLTSTTAWFLLADVPKNTGLVFIQRAPLKFAQDNDSSTLNLDYYAYERYNAGVVNPMAVWGTDGV